VRTPRRLVNPTTGEVYYRVRYRAGGRQRALSFHAETERLALADADEFVGLLKTLGDERAVQWWNDHLDREPGDRGVTLEEWWPRYLESLTGITEGTRVTYQRTYLRVWAEPLGDRPLAAISREDIARVVNDLSATKSDKTVRNAFGVLSSCLKVASADGLIPTVPTRGIRLPRRTEHTATEMRFLDHDEWQLLYDALPRHYRPLFTFLVGTGARWGEAEALTVGDVALAGGNPVVRITKAAKWNASKSTRDVGPTKTRKSRRTITLPPEVADELAPLVAGRAKGERLFLAPRGGQLRHRTAYDEWKAAVARAGLDPQPRIHDLRHTHVAWLIAAGIPLPVIQARLGHEHISTTIDRYGHLLPDLQVAAANAASVAMAARPAIGPSS
jgi:integrase